MEDKRRMENLEHRIEILGTTPTGWFPSLGMGMIGVLIFPPLLFLIAVPILLFDRWRNKRSAKGTPLSYEMVVIRNRDNRIIAELFPASKGLKEGSNEFR
ncbi:MAG: hypothetical protein COV57_03090 [Candidatus Liptonbacteria bacterium CG11_big_fil_rev_8_21_14_0_20_35_14]|uniref:Uncharacterized protein n=1 Tax=Candidatus Liptonbacteria bacterium CG11_big_fil_rev_8_21_14_0_20_35_14 TaxID=1974634 RepID=A0A2H0N718_9BACT|nr:MAG: hypothetical protein COV57_03090 [Candidatus Liptonbacteria bacterium CG11_big_fil_rev_8_21_14_0_20_35_14]